ncbi:MAG: hypothetical protein D3925_05640, partial [Candidatus Electrothrix sp. AR5]|nr:hypothetical protein [Candidatus Electrothrix sp. AR5]
MIKGSIGLVFCWSQAMRMQEIYNKHRGAPCVGLFSKSGAFFTGQHITRKHIYASAKDIILTF